jgi:hypothetical protein
MSVGIVASTARQTSTTKIQIALACGDISLAVSRRPKMTDSTEDPPENTTDRKLGVIVDLLGSISEQLEGQGDALNFIARCVAPRQDAEENQLEILLSGLISRMDRQSAILRKVSDGLTRLGKNLPLEIVRAIDENFVLPNTPTSGSRPNGLSGHSGEPGP